jgi:hypothetical protein
MLIGEFGAGVMLVLVGLMNLYMGYFGEYRELQLMRKKNDSAPEEKAPWPEKIRRARFVGILFCFSGVMMIFVSFIK